MPIITTEPNDPLKVWEFKALPKRGSQEALALLHRIAKQVQPVMRKRGWKVPLLSEFSPKSPNLLGLNINGGGGRTSEIKIRLRPHNSGGSFFPYEHLLGTMLHELVHNVQGPHNATFYKLLDEITEECERFMEKGITGSGAGFDAPSMGRLGGRGPVPIHNPPAHQLKNAALKAAEARSMKQSLMPSGPRKVGGDLSMLKGLTPAQAAARAAERRARDNVWCPCGDHGTSIGYTNDDGGVVVLDNAKQADQRSSGGPKVSQPSSTSMTQVSMPASSAASRLVCQKAREADLSAEDKHSASLLPDAQEQHVHQGHVACSSTVAHNKCGEQQRSALVSQQPQSAVSEGSMPSTKMPSASAKHDPASSSDLVDLTLDDSDLLPPHEPKSKRLRRRQHGTSQPPQTCANPTSEHDVCTVDTASASAPWPCSVCTLLNEDLSLQCSACGTARPAGFQLSHLSTCHPITHALSRPHVTLPDGNAWKCKFCSLMNAVASSHCSACAQWRYSYGAPHASRPTV